MKARDDETIAIDESHTDEPYTALLDNCSEIETDDSPLNDTTQTLPIEHKNKSDSNIDHVKPYISTSQDVTVDIHDEKDDHPSDDDTSNPFSTLLLSSDSENDNPSTSKATKRKERKIKSKQKPKKPERKIPDSFVAVRFSSPEIKAKIQLAQQSMVESDKKLNPTLISLVKLHVTLLTLQLSDVTLIDKYVHIMA